MEKLPPLMPTEHFQFKPSSSYAEALDRLALHYGIEPEYWDIFGKQHITTPEMKVSVLQAMGVDGTRRDVLDRMLEQSLWEEWSRLLPPSLVLSLGDGPKYVPITVPVAADTHSVDVEIQWETASAYQHRQSLEELEEIGRATLRGQEFVRRALPLREDAPLGYHKIGVVVESGQGPELKGETSLILCPQRAYVPPALEEGGKLGGLMFHLPGVRSERNWGCGDFTDLKALIDWAAHDVGAGFLALNPLHALANRAPYNTSPYLPVSIFYRNSIYLDVERIEDFARCRRAQTSIASPQVQEEIRALREAEFVQYERVHALKLRLLKLLFVQFLRNEWRNNTPRANQFRTYLGREGELLRRFALFCALDEHFHKRDENVWIWPEWPREYHDPESEACREFETKHGRRILFYQYVQWQLDLQLTETQEYALKQGMPLGLYHDLALATDRYGADFWGHRRFFVEGSRVGAPPDEFAPQGQDWSFPPPHTLHHHRTGYELFRESIRKNIDSGGALRIDHVMRFFHLFWIPEGQPPAAGTYVRDRHEDLIRILALESVRHCAMVVGEDLGTVAPLVREVLEEFGVLSYRLLFFEKDKDNLFLPSSAYPKQALVSLSTHDLPTLAGFWTGRDIEARLRAGVLDQAAAESAYEGRVQDKHALLDLFFREHLLPDWHPREASEIPELTPELHNAAVGFLSRTPALLMVLNHEDLTKEPDQQNLPGTTHQYPNWSRKTAYTVEQLRSHGMPRACAAMVRAWLERTGRSSR
jgi:4-alpha-glucanotransferase